MHDLIPLRCNDRLMMMMMMMVVVVVVVMIDTH